MAAVGTQGPALGNRGEKHAVGSPLRCAHVQVWSKALTIPQSLLLRADEVIQ